MPQELVLGVVFFNLFINVLDIMIINEVAKFVDNTKIFQVVKFRRDCKGLQKDCFQ